MDRQARSFSFLLAFAAILGCGHDGGGEPAIEEEIGALSVLTEGTPLRVVVGEALEVPVTIERSDFDGPVEVEIDGLPIDVAAASVTIPADSTEGILRLEADGNAVTEGPLTITVRAQADGAEPSSVEAVLYVAGLPGTIDSSYGADGFVFLNPAERDSMLLSSALQDSEGRIVVGGTAIGQDIDDPIEFLARVDASGQYDPSFGLGGKVSGLLKLNPGGVNRVLPNEDGGYEVVMSTLDGSSISYVIALDQNGQLRTDYGTSGYSEDFDWVFMAARVGASTVGVGNNSTGIKVSPNGQLDSDFEVPGSSFRVMFGQEDGILFGSSPQPGTDLIVYRSDDKGVIDTSFGVDGALRVPTLADQQSATMQTLSMDSQGRGLATGFVSTGVVGEVTPIVVRFDDSGSPVPTFGDGGLALALPAGAYGAPLGATIDAQGRVLVATSYLDIDGPGAHTFTIRRLLADGSPDPSFGRVDLPNAPISLFIDELAGRVTVVGSRGDVFIARIWL